MFRKRATLFTIGIEVVKRFEFRERSGRHRRECTHWGVTGQWDETVSDISEGDVVEIAGGD